MSAARTFDADWLIISILMALDQYSLEYMDNTSVQKENLTQI